MQSFEKVLRRALISAVHHRGCVLGTACFIALFGLFALPRLRLEPLPDFAPLQVQIFTAAPGKNAADINRIITKPLMMTLSEGRPASILRIQGVSEAGASQISLFVGSAKEMEAALSFVRARVHFFSANSDIPSGYQAPEILPAASPLASILEFCLVDDAKTLSEGELSFLLKQSILPSLRHVPGVYSVVSSGGGERVYKITLDPQRLEADYRLNLQHVTAAIQAAAFRDGTGIDADGNMTALENTLRGSSSDILAALKALPISASGEASLPLEAISENIASGFSQRDGFACDKDGEFVLGRVFRNHTANSAEVDQQLKQKIEEIRSRLPKGVRLEILWQKLETSNRELWPLIVSIGVGWAAVIVVVYCIFGSLRLSLVAFLVMPFSLLASAAILHVAGIISGNGIILSLIAIGAIDFGFCVDSSLNVLDSIERELVAGSGRLNAVVRGTLRARTAAVVSELAVIASMEAVRWLPGRSGELFAPVVVVLQVLLACSAVASCTLVPVLAYMVLRTRSKPQQEASALEEQLAGFADFFSDIPGRTLLVINIAVVMLAVPIFFATPWEALPNLDEGSFLVHIKQSPQQSFQGSVKTVRDICRNLQGLSEVEKVYASAGISSDDPMLFTEADVRVLLKPRTEWRAGMTRQELEARLLTIMREKHASVLASVHQPIDFRVTELSGYRADVVVSLTGPEELYPELMKRGTELARRLSKVPVIQAAISQPQGVISEQRLVVNRDRSLELGVERAAVETLSEARFGKLAGTVLENNLPVNVQVELSEANRRSENFLLNRVVGAGGKSHSLDSFVEVEEHLVPSKILRLDNEVQVAVLVTRVSGMSLQATAREVKKQVEASGVVGDFSVQYGGRFVDEGRVVSGMLVGFCASAVMVLIFVWVALRSGKLAGLSILAMLTSAAISTFVLTKLGRSGAGVLGMTVGIGLAAMFYIMWVSAAERRRKLLLPAHRNDATALLQIARETTRERLRAIVATAIATSSGYIGLALGAFGVFGNPESAALARPFAFTVTVGVLCMAMYISFVLPRLYVLILGLASSKQATKVEE